MEIDDLVLEYKIEIICIKRTIEQLKTSTCDPVYRNSFKVKLQMISSFIDDLEKIKCRDFEGTKNE